MKKVNFSQFARQLNGSPRILQLCSHSFLSSETNNVTQVAWCVLHSYCIQHRETPFSREEFQAGLGSAQQPPAFSGRERQQAIQTI